MIQIINGPNLNMLGVREPDIYGRETFESYLEKLKALFPGEEIKYFQSNSEGELIDCIQKAGMLPECRGIVLNPAAYTHYSIAIADAISSVKAPVVEVHISNIHARESFRHETVTGARAKAVLTGFGLKGYELAVSYLLDGPTS